MKIYNSITNKLEEFKPLNEGKVTMYVCGPTVNKRTHLGHMYPAIVFDTVYRYFKYKGYNVKYASNFTDIDDKIIEASIEENITEKEVADKYTQLYLEDLKKINCLEIDYRPKVTEYINDIIEFINVLLKNDFAYKEGDDVFLDVKKIKDYGLLSNQKLDDLVYGSRIKVNQNKRNPYDFVLWKKTNKGIMWDTPFGKGRPGWHTECVVMINKIFNDMIDIHGGGIDLIFPHHENEIAQSKAVWKHSLANYWMHNGHLMVDGVKMSKSLGNIVTVDELLQKYTPNTIRLGILKNNYRIPLNLTDDLFNESITIDEKLNNVLKSANLFISINNLKINLIKKDETIESYMDDDFNTSNLITLLLDYIKILNQNLRNNEKEDIIKYYDKINLINFILGLKYELKNINEEDIKLYNEWDKERRNKNFELADNLRTKLIERNIL